MSQMNEESEGSNVVGTGAVALTPVGGKLSEPRRRKAVDEMKDALKERVSRMFSKEKSKQ